MTDARTTCPACLDSSPVRTFSVAEMMFGKDESFTYAECAGCGSARLLDVPADLSAYYPEDYYSIDTDPEQVLGRTPRRQIARIMGRSALFGRGRLVDLARRVISMRQFHTLMSTLDSVSRAGGRRESARVLDIGCGSGALVYALAAAGIRRPTGVDPFAPTDRVFDNGATIRRTEPSALEAASFDVVMFHHSFEHVPSPRESLESAMRLLAPGGRILIRMPTVSSEAFERYGADWVQLDAPRHLTVFSRKGMDLLVRSVGLTTEQVWDDSTSFQFWGSEQVRAGMSLMAPDSLMTNSSSPLFASAQLRHWEAEARRLNAENRGDQAVWVLRCPDAA